jgi:L-2-hydroxyglutarate oxidase LhgO
VERIDVAVIGAGVSGLLYQFCADHHVPHRRCGKIIIANNSSETHVLEELLRLGRSSGVEDLEIVDAAFIAEREPHVHAVAARRAV